MLTNKTHSVLYTGVTADMLTRIEEHRNKTNPNSFSAKYNCNKLVYYYAYAYIEEAIAGEKLTKGGSRKSKVDLINSVNPLWTDLYDQLI